MFPIPYFAKGCTLHHFLSSEVNLAMIKIIPNDPHY